MGRRILAMILTVVILLLIGGWTDADADDIAKVIYKEGNNQPVYDKSLIAWCILNRVDRDGQSVHKVVTRPHQFAYRRSAPVTEENRAVAEDVLTRWELEKKFGGWVGRTLPSDYYWFAGHGGHNWFRNRFRGKGSRTFANLDLYEHDNYLGGEE